MVDDHDGAVWLRSTDFGDDKDRVLVKSDGEFTYLLPDIAYHRDKYARGFDLLIDVWGADHHGYVPRMKAAMQALGHDPDELECAIIQLVNLLRGGEPVRLSKRSGDIIELADVLDEVGADAARLTYLLQSIDSPQTFDFDVVKSQAMENPVFYVQMAYARIRSIERVAAEREVTGSRSPRSTGACWSTSASSRCSACSPSCPTPSWPRPTTGPLTASPPGCASWPAPCTASTTTATSWVMAWPPSSPRPGSGWSRRRRSASAIGLDLLGVSAPDEM